jgi:hypothetical protein
LVAQVLLSLRRKLVVALLGGFRGNAETGLAKTLAFLFRGAAFASLRSRNSSGSAFAKTSAENSVAPNSVPDQKLGKL